MRAIAAVSRGQGDSACSPTKVVQSDKMLAEILLCRTSYADSDDSREEDDEVVNRTPFASLWVMKTPGSRPCNFLLEFAAATGPLINPNIILRMLALSRVPILAAIAAMLRLSSEKEPLSFDS